jgi:hypothetical protein
LFWKNIKGVVTQLGACDLPAVGAALERRQQCTSQEQRILKEVGPTDYVGTTYFHGHKQDRDRVITVTANKDPPCFPVEAATSELLLRLKSILQGKQPGWEKVSAWLQDNDPETIDVATYVYKTTERGRSEQHGARIMGLAGGARLNTVLPNLQESLNQVCARLSSTQSARLVV